jgi:hypothetical protein
MKRLFGLTLMLALVTVFPIVSTNAVPLPKTVNDPLATKKQLEEAKVAFAEIGGVLSVSANNVQIPFRFLYLECPDKPRMKI